MVLAVRQGACCNTRRVAYRNRQSDSHCPKIGRAVWVIHHTPPKIVIFGRVRLTRYWNGMGLMASTMTLTALLYLRSRSRLNCKATADGNTLNARGQPLTTNFEGPSHAREEPAGNAQGQPGGFHPGFRLNAREAFAVTGCNRGCNRGSHTRTRLLRSPKRGLSRWWVVLKIQGCDPPSGGNSTPQTRRWKIRNGSSRFAPSRISFGGQIGVRSLLRNEDRRIFNALLGDAGGRGVRCTPVRSSSHPFDTPSMPLPCPSDTPPIPRSHQVIRRDVLTTRAAEWR